MSELCAHRGRVLHCLQDPGDENNSDAIDYFADGVLILRDGHVVEAGPSQLLDNYSDDLPCIDHDGRIIMPGMIDCHVHYAQIDIIGAYGHQLLDWLNHSTFPAEGRYNDPAVAAASAETFVDELLCNGTTTALVFATVHPQSVEALFSAALARNMRLATGKVLMDRNCPEYLRDTADTGYQQSKELLEKWHGQQRLHYAITPRFAPTSSSAQLKAAGKLAREYPDVLMQTHLAENLDEIAWVAELFPDRHSYLDVYQHAGLVRERSVFAHCVHLDDHHHKELASHGAAIAFCPSSNLFLGSGLFDLASAKAHQVRVGLGTDVGGGTSLSLLRTLGDAYKVLQLQRQSLTSLRGIYLATLGAAEALYMDDKIGNFAPGKEADFVVLSQQPTPLMEHRLTRTSTLPEELFVHMTLGDDRSIDKTYVMGECVYTK